MPSQLTPATNSAAELHKLVGDDATATFENDPKFSDSDPAASASSENLDEQRAGAGQEFQAAAAPGGKGAGPDADEEDDDLEDDEDDEDDLEDDEDDEDDEEYEDDDDDLEDEDDEDSEDDEDEDENDLEDEDDEDDADELEASASPLRADGLLGYEDEAEDTREGVDRVTGDVNRKRDEARKLTDDPDENPYDAYTDVDPAAVREEEVDSNVVIRPVKPMDLLASARGHYAAM